MKLNNFIKRLLLNTELEDAYNLLFDSKDEFIKYYPKYPIWLDKTFKEIRAGERIILGLYSSKFEGCSIPKSFLIGTAILIKNRFTKTIELKSFFIEKNERRNKFGTVLCDAVNNFCKKHGYKKIVTQIPALNISVVHFFLKNGFQIKNQIVSDYVEKSYIYEMIKPVKSFFIGDPFDIKHFSLWLMKNVYQFRIIEVNQNYLSLSKPINDEIESEKLIDYEINGIILIVDNEIDINNVTQYLDDLTEKGKIYDIKFLIALDFEEKCYKMLKENKDIFPISKKRAFFDFKDFILYRNYNYTKEKIGGLILLIKQDYFSRIKENIDFIYIKSGNVGKFLEIDDLILFLVEPNNEEKNYGIKGYGYVKSSEIDEDSIDLIWDKIKSENPIFSKEDLKKFAKNKDSLQILHIKNFSMVNSIDYDNLSIFFNEKSLDFDDWGNFYFNQEKKVEFLSQYDQKKEKDELYKANQDFMLKELIKSEIKYHDKTITNIEIASFLNQIDDEDLRGSMINILYVSLKYNYKMESLITLLNKEIQRITVVYDNLIFLVFDDSYRESQGLWTKLMSYHSSTKSKIYKIADFLKIKDCMTTKKHAILILDDFVGTGNQFLAKFEKEIKPHKDIFNQFDKNIFLLFGFCSPKIIDLIHDETNIKKENIIYCIQILEEHNAFNSKYFPNSTHLEQFQSFLKNKDPFYWDGWKKDNVNGKGLALLITTEWKIPNNTIGCLWHQMKKENTVTWNPLYL